MPIEKIIVHEDLQGDPMEVFLRRYWKPRLFGPFPKVEEAAGRVNALVNHGRWLAECPGACGGALLVSEAFPYFVCIDCGSPENLRRFYLVAFPPEKAEIEAALLKRPARTIVEAANWMPNESVDDLKRENAERGIR